MPEETMHMDPWQEAVDDALVCHALDCTGSDSDPSECVSRLVRTAVEMALDPAISEQAQALINQGAAGIIEVLRHHWLSAMECDPVAERNKPHCVCSRVDLGWHPTQWAAAEAWLAHVSVMRADGAGVLGRASLSPEQVHRLWQEALDGVGPEATAPMRFARSIERAHSVGQ